MDMYKKWENLLCVFTAGIFIAVFVLFQSVQADEEHTEQEQITTRTLRCAEADFYSSVEERGFLGAEGVQREDLVEVTFYSMLEGMPDNAFDVSEEEDGSVFLWEEEEGTGKFVIAAEDEVKANKDSAYLFRDCPNLRSVDFNDSFSSCETTDMTGMFQNCVSLEKITFGWFYTDHVETMESMFEGCEKLTDVDLDHFDTSNVGSMMRMFYGCGSLQTLDISGFSFQSVSTADMFTGTRWEGSSPLLDDVEPFVDYSMSLIIGGILDTGDWLTDQPRLRTAVIEEYMSVLYAMEIFTEYENEMYALLDLDEDGIPEMIWRGEADGEYYYKIFCFQTVCCAAYDVVGEDKVCMWSKDLLFWEGHGLFWESDEGEYVQMRLENRELSQIYAPTTLHPEECAEPVHFTKVKPKKVYDKKTDIVGDDSDVQICILVSEDENGPDYYAVCVGSTKIYGAPVGEDWSSDVYANVFVYTTHDQDIIFYLGMYSGNKTYVEEFLKLDAVSFLFQRMTVLDDLIDERQLYTKNNERNQMAIANSSATAEDMGIFFSLNTLGFGKLTFDLDYRIDSYGLEQTSWLHDLSAGSCDIFEYLSYTLSGKADFYKNPGSRDIAYTLQEGDIVTPDWVWLSDRILWVRVKDEKGRTGWLPASETVFYETSGQARLSESASFAEQNQRLIFGCAQPDGERLYEKGNHCFEEGLYEYALFYYGMLGTMDGNYAAAKNKIKEAEALYTEELFEWIETLLDESDYRSSYANLSGLTEGSGDPETNQYLNELDYKQARELLVSESELLQNDTRYSQYLESCDTFFAALEQEKADSQGWLREKQSELLAELQQQARDSGNPILYCLVDFDGNDMDELIIKSQQRYVGTVSYSIYRYTEESGRYEEVPGYPVVPAKAYGRIFQWKERNCLLLEDYDEDGNDVLQAFAFSENYLEKTLEVYGPGNCFRELEFQEYDGVESETEDNQELPVLWKVEY